MPTYFEFEVSLRWIKPRIWRRFLLPTTATFADLHRAIQDAFGWEDCHLFSFGTPGRRSEEIAGIPDDSGFGGDTPDARRVGLSGYFAEDHGAKKCDYTYDFGDSWDHEVKLRKVVTEEASFARRLLAGARACPPEDSGGVPGYERMVQFATTGVDPYGDDAVDLSEWLGDWKPDVFDLAGSKDRFARAPGAPGLRLV